MLSLVASEASFGKFSNYDVGSTFYTEVFAKIKRAEELYPGFSGWYWDKVISDVECGTKKFITHEVSGVIQGVVIIKNDVNESKLCNLTVFEGFRNKGIGLELFEKSFEFLGTEKPFLTVSEEKYSEFKRLFDYYGFEVTSVKDGLYRPGKIEYFLNESVSSLI
jgi:ribosomal protein S18 acetylase RimI-like enzyme